MLIAGGQPPAVWRSDDAGVTWRELAALTAVPERVDWYLPGPGPLDRLPGGRVGALLWTATELATLYAAIEAGGVYRSDDGGATWLARNAGLPGLAVHALASDPQAPETLFAATETGVYRSTDGGACWVLLPIDAGAAYTRALALLPPDAPGGNAVLLAGPAEVQPWDWAEEADGARARLLRGTDNGMHWEPVGGGLPESFPELIGTIAVAPRDPAQAWLGTWGGEVYATRDAGLRWQQIAEGLGHIWALCVLEE